MRAGVVLAVVVFVFALGATVGAASESIPAFRDVPKSHWAAEAVQALAEWGITTGYPDPDAPIPAFSDVPRSHWAAEAVQALAEWGILASFRARAQEEVPDWAREAMEALTDWGILHTD